MTWMRRKFAWYSWKAWNRTRYYWPQARSRRRAIASLQSDYARYGEAYKPIRPWWIP